jgi:hypothetical protein
LKANRTTLACCTLSSIIIHTYRTIWYRHTDIFELRTRTYKELNESQKQMCLKWTAEFSQKALPNTNYPITVIHVVLSRLCCVQARNTKPHEKINKYYSWKKIIRTELLTCTAEETHCSEIIFGGKKYNSWNTYDELKYYIMVFGSFCSKYHVSIWLNCSRSRSLKIKFAKPLYGFSLSAIIMVQYVVWSC